MGRSLAGFSFALILGVIVPAAAARGAPPMSAPSSSGDRPMIWIPNHVVPENAALTFTVVAIDDAAPSSAFTYSMRLGDPPAAGATLASSTGAFSWTPTESQGPGIYPVTICATQNGSRGRVTGCGTFMITVLEVDAPPVAKIGRPYSGVVRAPVTFDGSASNDPDGGPLTFSWDFGDGDTSNYVIPIHTYETAGMFNVKLRVTDLSGLHGDDATTAIMAPFFSAQVFFAGGSGTIRLGSGEPTTCVQIESAPDSYSIWNVDLTSIRVLYNGHSIPAVMEETGIGADEDKNGIQEITACFPKTGIAMLLVGQPGGDYPTLIEGKLVTGGSFQGALTLHVVGPGGPGELSASILPNPLSLAGSLRFRTSKSGSLNVALYDLQGRLVRIFLRDTAAAAGDHDLKIEARDMRGGRLPSGIYYLRIQSSVDGESTKPIAVTK